MTIAHTSTGRTPISWWACEPRRLHRDQEEITTRFPGLAWNAEGAGSWEGRLPRWPFDRPEPERLADWTGSDGLLLRIEYSQAYPMVVPRLVPLDPLPELDEWTQHRWHVNGDASLCLLRDDIWTGRESVVDLLLKAAAWRVEYALMKAGAIEQMSANGIVDDHCFDDFLTQLPTPAEPSGHHEPDGPAC
ncbi:hypothetical protein [Streptomyces sp. NPDC055056]